MKITVLILLLLLTLSRVHAQFAILAHTDHLVRDMITFDNKFFIGGSFTSIGNTIASYGSAHYDDGQFVGHAEPQGYALEFAIFDNELYAVGNWYFPGGTAGVAKWDGSKWVMEGGLSNSHLQITVAGNYLYVIDINGLIRRKTAGGNFEVFKDFSGDPDVYLTEAGSYQGNFCLMGRFEELEGLPFRNIAMWNGTAWQALGTGMADHAWKSLVFQNELYVVGNFYDTGIPTTHIAKWNGTSWSDVGLGVTGNAANGIYSIIPWDNRLFVFGDFDEIGNQSADDIAAWDGQQWTPYFTPHNELVLNTAGVYNGRLYFSGFGGTQPFHIYGYSGLLSTDELTEASVGVHPNPSDGVFYLSGAQNASSYEVLNSLGQVVLSGSNPAIDLSTHESGVYFLRYAEGGGSYKLVKE